MTLLVWYILFLVKNHHKNIARSGLYMIRKCKCIWKKNGKTNHLLWNNLFIPESVRSTCCSCPFIQMCLVGGWLCCSMYLSILTLPYRAGFPPYLCVWMRFEHVHLDLLGWGRRRPGHRPTAILYHWFYWFKNVYFLFFCRFFYNGINEAIIGETHGSFSQRYSLATSPRYPQELRCFIPAYRGEGVCVSGELSSE